MDTILKPEVLGTQINGSSLMGEVSATYEELVMLYGKPNGFGDDYKTDAEWELRSKGGDIVTIYNWKDGYNYCGSEGSPVEAITEWHVGGFHNNVTHYVSQDLSDLRRSKMQASSLRAGDRLPNGSTVVEYVIDQNGDGIVLAKDVNKTTPYATWEFYRNDPRSTSHGHYSFDETEAMQDYRARRALFLG